MPSDNLCLLVLVIVANRISRVIWGMLEKVLEKYVLNVVGEL